MNNLVFEKAMGRDCVGMYWLANVLPKNDHRFHCTHIQISDYKSPEGADLNVSQAVASDGAVLHHYTCQNQYPEGYYAVTKKTKSRVDLLRACSLDDGQYPDWEPLFCTDKPDYSFPVVGYNPYWGYAQIIRAMPEKQTLNVDLFKRAMSGNGKDPWTCMIWEDGKGLKPMELAQGNYRALIMPMMG